MAKFHDLIGRALSDAAFCDELVRDPEATLRANEVEPTDEMLEALRNLDGDTVRKLASAFGKTQAAS